LQSAVTPGSAGAQIRIAFDTAVKIVVVNAQWKLTARQEIQSQAAVYVTTLLVAEASICFALGQRNMPRCVQYPGPPEERAVTIFKKTADVDRTHLRLGNLAGNSEQQHDSQPGAASRYRSDSC
jgi:hypothetical protein